MRNIEDDIRELLDEEARSAPAPHETPAVVGRTQRRQGAVIAGGALAAIALVAVGIVGLRAVGTADRGIPADQPTVTTTLNGISMSHPEGWYVVDPDEAGLNGPDPTPDLPRLVFAVAPFDPGELFGCPGMVEGTPHAFLMTIQEEARALSGAASAPWPVALEPLGVDASEAACYPEWEFLRAGWTAAGRTFEARVGFAPDVSDADREALFAAFASMTFEPGAEAAMSVVLATGTAGGEEWELIANRQTDGVGCTYSVHAREQGIWTRLRNRVRAVRGSCRVPDHKHTEAVPSKLSGRRSGLDRESSIGNSRVGPLVTPAGGTPPRPRSWPLA